MNLENDNLLSTLDEIVDSDIESVKMYEDLWDIFTRAFPDSSERDKAKMIVLCISIGTWAIETRDRLMGEQYEG